MERQEVEEVKGAIEERRYFEISIGYVGDPAQIKVRPHERVRTVLEMALHAFDIRGEKERFALFNESGVRLNAEETVECAGIRAHEKLSLRFEIFIIHNGVRKSFYLTLQELVSAILTAAIKAFGISQAPHLLGLFSEAGVELNDRKTVSQSDIKPGEKLLLRPSAVRAG